MENHSYQAMAEVETRHWWFCGRRKIIRQYLQRLKLPHRAQILEVGAGTGGNIQLLQAFGDVTAIESSNTARELSQHNIQPGSLPTGLPDNLGQFDLIVLLDVLEHIAEDTASLQRLSQHLKPNGKLLITVPALPLLWSQHDVIAHHHRRYTKQSLTQATHNTPLTIQYSRYFNSLLLPLIAPIRILQRWLNYQPTHVALHCPPRPINRLLTSLLACERYLPYWLTPVGVSLLAVATRTDSPND